MRITSPFFKNNGFLPSKFTCDGDDSIPELNITDVPVEAKSLALIIDDPDAPGGNFVHWLLWNIKPETTKIAENLLPPAIFGINDFGKDTYGGPCPPRGIHHYHFKIYALSSLLELPKGENIFALKNAMKGKILAEAEIIGLYQRK